MGYETLVILFVFLLVVLAIGIALRQGLKQRAAARKQDSDLLDGLRKVAAELRLTEPAHSSGDGPLSLYSCRGTVHGLPAELATGGRGYHQVSVQLVAVGLPEEIGISPRPRGRGMEDYHLGVVIDSGEPLFDEHHCLHATSNCIGDALKAKAATVPRELLGFVANSFNPSFEVRVTSTELRLSPGKPSLPWTSATSLRWPSSPENLANLWRSAERVVRHGFERKVLVARR